MYCKSHLEADRLLHNCFPLGIIVSHLVPPVIAAERYRGHSVFVMRTWGNQHQGFQKLAEY